MTSVEPETVEAKSRPLGSATIVMPQKVKAKTRPEVRVPKSNVVVWQLVAGFSLDLMAVFRWVTPSFSLGKGLSEDFSKSKGPVGAT